MLLNKRISIIYFLKLIKWDALAIFCYTVLVGSVDHLPFFTTIIIPLGLSALIGTLLSLLLAFRTSQSYERWWEARVVWGSIVNDSRTLIRQLSQFIPNDDTKDSYIKSFVDRQSVWCYALTHSLRRIEMPINVKEYCFKHNLVAENLPNLLLSKHADELFLLSDKYKLDANKQVQLDNTIQRLTDAMGKCERIKNTVFPRSYSLLIHFLIYVLMTILPFGLDHNNHFVEIFLATLVPALFIGIERTAILMQDPFENKPTDIAMIALSETIERNLAEMTGRSLAPKPAVTSSYYIM